MKTRLAGGGSGIDEAVGLLKAGQLVALPTETVYGLGGAALEPEACVRIFEAKSRPLDDPLIVHLPAPDWIERLAEPVPLALQLAKLFWPGPLTMILRRKPIVPDIVTAGQGTVALRMSAHPVFQEVIGRFGQPIAAPSANRFGRISPTTAQDVVKELGGAIPFILDGGPCVHGVESTILLVRDTGVEIFRHGPVTAEQLAVHTRILPRSFGTASPGGMERHYAPAARLIILEKPGDAENFVKESGVRTGVLAWGSAPREGACVEFLSRHGDLREAAANLYGALRRLDEAGVEVIAAEPVPETGLGRAIMERLRKASGRE